VQGGGSQERGGKEAQARSKRQKINIKLVEKGIKEL